MSYRSGAPGGGGSTIPRASTFTVPSTGRSAPPRAPPGDRPSGQYNSRRDVPAPSTDTSAPYASGAYGSSHGGPAMLVTKGGLVAGSKASPLYTKAVIMVDEATEPGIGDEDGRRRRVALVEMVQTGGDPRLGNPAGNSPGAAVAHAIRKRLKSDDYVAVVNCLTLLDETMRTCPYFYRYIANDKFFRRMWRFVDPEYKSDLRGKLPFSSGSKASKAVAAQRSSANNIELAERVLILIRAWAEELSIMHNGTQDTDAGFFIERYTNKRMRIKFPDVPVTATPWVCPVGTTPGRSRFANYGGGSGRRGTTTTTKSPLPKSLSLAEVENTVSLFSNLLEKANDISEVRGDLCGDLAERCRLISQHIDTMSATMEKDEDIARAIKVSETLQKTLASYDEALASGVLNTAPPVIVNGLSDDDESADEGYDAGPGRSYSASPYYGRDHDDPGDGRGAGAVSRRRDAAGASSSASYDRRDRSDERDRTREGGASERRLEVEEGLEKVERERERERESEREREREERVHGKAQARKEKEAERRRAEKKEARKLALSTSKSSSVKSDKPASRAAAKADAAADAASAGGKSGKAAKQSGKAGAARDTLVDVTGPVDARSSSSDASGDKKDDAFNLLAERYTSNRSNKSSLAGASTPEVSSSSLPPLPPAATGVPTAAGAFGMSGVVAGVQGLSMAQPGHVAPPHPMSAEFLQQAHPQQHQLPYGSVLAMPNPMAMSMYGSYNPAAMQQQQPYGALPSAYNTISPSMYYHTVNPLAYASAAPVMHQPAAASSPSLQSSAGPSAAASTTPAYQMPAQMPSQMTAPPPAAEVAAPPPPPPPLPSAYTTVTNAPAPPPSEPPPRSTGTRDPPQDVSPAHQPHPHGQQPQPTSPMSSALSHQPPVPTPQMEQQQVPMMVQPHPMYNPAMYASISGQPLAGNQSFLYSSASPQQLPPQPQQAPNAGGAPPNAMNPYPSMAGQPGAFAAGGAEQAAMYQSAMANAAAAYHAASTAYQSVQGHAPLAPRGHSQRQDPSAQSSNAPQQ